MAVSICGPLARTVAGTATDLWIDSCAVAELGAVIAVGATANPTIVSDVWKADKARRRAVSEEFAREHPSWTEADLARAIVEAMSLQAAPLLILTFTRSGGRQSRLSIQTDPTLRRTPDRMLEQGIRFAGLAFNMIVKILASQAVAVAEAVERGLCRREAEGLPTDRIGPGITIMMGRIKDWLDVQFERDASVADPAALPGSGIAVFKVAYRISHERGLHDRLLGAAIRHHYHWSELIGGDVVLTLPAVWQARFEASDVEVRPRMDEPLDSAIVDELANHSPDFVREVEPDGLTLPAFLSTVQTLRAFIDLYHELIAEVWDTILSEPDRRLPRVT